MEQQNQEEEARLERERNEAIRAEYERQQEEERLEYERVQRE